MKKSIFTLVLPVLLVMLLGGCAVNKTTDPSRVPSKAVPEATYADLSCQRLASDLDGLLAKEQQWVDAQNTRRGDSKIMEILLGVGRGDGREYDGLAEVRGHIDAVLSVMDRKGCNR